MTRPGKPDIAANPAYFHIAEAVLGELHEHLFSTLEERLGEKEGKKHLLVVGPGSEMLPYSNQWERTQNLIQGGSISVMDYNQDIIDKIPGHLKSQGIKEKVIKGKKPFDRRKPTVFTFRGDVVDDLDNYDLREKFDAIEMTVSVHHATQNYTATDKIFKDAYKALKPGGTLYIGEGNIDMKHSTRKIHKILDDLESITEEEFGHSDRRNKDRSWHNPNREYNDGQVEIDAKGYVTITHPEKGPQIYEALKAMGYDITNYGGKQNVMPLIDPNDKGDQEHIGKVEKYYDDIRGLMENIPDEHKEAAFAALAKEENDAKRGLVEHYSHPDYLVHIIVENGFVIKDMQYMQNSPFVGIVAEKPYK